MTTDFDDLRSGFGTLDGLVVIDLSTGIAAPTATMLLADHGATVITVERPHSPNMNRTAAWQLNGTSAWWYLLGRNKHTITLNLKQSRGAELLKQLVERADVVVENFRPGKLEALGLAPAVLHDINPSLVVLRLTGWGQDGPYSTMPSYGSLAESMSGLANGTGEANGPPVLSSFALADPIAGVFGAFAILAALWPRLDRRGRLGEVIDLSLAEAMFSVLGPQAMAYDALGEVQRRLGSRSPTFAPRNVYQTSDSRYVAVSASAQNIVNRCFDAMGRPELRDDSRFSSPEARTENADELDALFAAWIGERTRHTVVDTLRRADATVAPIYDIADVLDDPHFQQREMVTSVPTTTGDAVKLQNVVPKLGGQPGHLRWAGRPMGSSNEEIFVQLLGLPPDELNRLRAAGVV